MSQFNMEVVVATKGNQGLFDGNEIYSFIEQRGGNEKRVCNVLTGQPVLYNPKTLEVLTVADIPNAKSIAFAVGFGKEGHTATDIRTIGRNSIDLCDFKIEASAVAPNSGCNEITDIYFDCIDCHKTYAFVVELDDHIIRSRYEYRNHPKYIYTATAKCTEDCKTGDCDDAVADVNELAREFARKVNDRQAAAKNFGKEVMFQRYNNRDHRPFTAIPIFKQNYKFNVDVSKASNGVAVVPKFTNIRVDGTATAFTNAEYIVDDTKTTLEQLEGVVSQINKVLGANGSAVLDQASGLKDTNLTIHVTAISDSVALEIGGTYVTGNRTELDKTGIRLFADPVDWECFCDLPPNVSPPNTFFRRLDVYQTGENWKYDGFETKKVQSSCTPMGMGLLWKHKEMLHTEGGGQGRDFRYSNSRVGNYGLPGIGSPILNTTVDCDTLYCNYGIVYASGTQRKYSGDMQTQFSQQARVLIPEDDTTTKSVMEAILAALFARGLCSDANVTCTPAGEDAPELDVTLNAVEATAGGATVPVPFTFDGGSESETLVVTSADEAIATAAVSGTDIVITGVAAGTVTITVASSLGTVQDSIAVTVVAA